MSNDIKIHRRVRAPRIQTLFGLNTPSSAPRGAEVSAAVPRLRRAGRVKHDNIEPLGDQPPRRDLTTAPSGDRIEQRLTVLPIPHFPQSSDIDEPKLLPLSAGAIKHQLRQHLGFVICVLMPIFVATLYFGFIASNQYVAEFRFAVKDVSSQGAAAAGASGIMAALGGGGGSSAYNNYLVTDYLTSRQAADELQKRINIISLYSRPETDWWARYNSSRPIEKFVSYWQGMITANYDMVTGIATAQVRAFTPQDALLIAKSMLKLSEELVNRIDSRAQNDAVSFAQKEVDRAEARVKVIRAKLTEFRNRLGVIDPNASVVASNSTLVQNLQSNLSQLEMQMATLINQKLSPTGPAVQALKSQIKSTKEQLTSIEANVVHTRTGETLSSAIAEYEQLDLERQFAQNMLTSALQALDGARANAAAQHVYITPFISPNLPESASYPRRFMSILTVGALAFGVWLAGLLVVRSIRERFG